MGLAVKNFFSMRPQLSFRFSVDIIEKEKDIGKYTNLGICVKNVKVTTGESDTAKGAAYYGNGYFTIPVYNIADKTLEISFNETDDLYVLKWLDCVQFKQANGIPEEIDIRITEYDETMTNEISKILYTCHLKEYSEPAFSRSGSVSFSTIDATFIVIDEINELVKNEAIIRNARIKEAQANMEGYKPNSMEGYKPNVTVGAGTGFNRSNGVGWGVPFVAVKGRESDGREEIQGPSFADAEGARYKDYEPLVNMDGYRPAIDGDRSSGVGKGGVDEEPLAEESAASSLPPEAEISEEANEEQEQIPTKESGMEGYEPLVNMDGYKPSEETEYNRSSGVGLGLNPETPNEPQENDEVSRLDTFIKAMNDTLAYVQLNNLKYSQADTTDMRLSFDDPNKFKNKKEKDAVGDREGIDCSSFVSQGLYAAFGDEFAKYANGRKESATTWDIQRFYNDHKDYFEVIEVKEGTELKKGDIALRAAGGTLKKGKEHQSAGHVLVIGEDKTITSMNDQIYTMEATNDKEKGVEGKRRTQGEFRRSAGYLKGISGTKHGGYLILRIKDKKR